MNRLCTVNTEGITPETQPPLKREGPVRMLFVSGVILGFKRYAEQLEQWTEGRDDIDAVHVRISAPLPIRVASATWPLPAGWDFHSFRYLMLTDLMIRGWFSRAIDLRRYDVVHWMTQGNARTILPLSRRHRARHAVNIDGTTALDWREFGYSKAARAPFTAQERKIFHACDLIACRNQWAGDSVRDDFGVPESKIHVARSGMVLERPSKWASPAPARSGGELPRLVFVGNTWQRKGGDRLLRLHQERFADRVELHFLGRGHEKDERARNVIWHGEVPHERVVELLPTMDLAVFPTNEDQLPRASIECAAVGLPLVATRLAAIPEICRHEHNGLLVPRGDDRALADAIERMLGDASLRERYGRAGRALVEEEFDASKTFPALLDRLAGLADAPADGDHTP